MRVERQTERQTDRQTDILIITILRTPPTGAKLQSNSATNGADGVWAGKRAPVGRQSWRSCGVARSEVLDMSLHSRRPPGVGEFVAVCSPTTPSHHIHSTSSTVTVHSQKMAKDTGSHGMTRWQRIWRTSRWHGQIMKRCWWLVNVFPEHMEGLTIKV